jgi:hypothetical protein
VAAQAAGVVLVVAVALVGAAPAVAQSAEQDAI